MRFEEKLSKIVEKNNSLLCVGLDIDKEKIGNTDFLGFNKKIIDETKDLVCAYKLNMAFYETLGKEGYTLLEETIKRIPEDIIIILDGKRNDIGNTAKKYATSLFEKLKCDAVTINPYLGSDGIKPFLDYKEKYSFILCRTSNQSAKDFQDLKIENKALYLHVAEKIKQWNKDKNAGAVVGATYPDELREIRQVLGEDAILLIPGIGAQGGDVEKTIKYGKNKNGKNAIINSSRGIIYSENPRESAMSLRNEINKYR